MSRPAEGLKDVRADRSRANVKNWKDALAVFGYLLFCLVLLLSTGFMMWEIEEHAHPPVEVSALG